MTAATGGSAPSNGGIPSRLQSALLVAAVAELGSAASRVMIFKRSSLWGLGGAVCVTLLGFLLLNASKPLGDVTTHFFLLIGLNPREQGVWCLLLFVAFTSVIGFLAGRGVGIGRPHA